MKDYFGIGGRLALTTFVTMALTMVVDLLLQAYVIISREILPFYPPLFALGLAMAIVGLGCNAVAGTYMVRAVRAGKLATTGPFARSRNPMYASFIFMTMPGLAIALHCFVTLLVVPAVMYRYFRAHIEAEERRLAEQFGDEYLAYKQRVNRLLP